MSIFDPHMFWKDPAESTQPPEVRKICNPEWYLDLGNVTRLVVDTILQYVDKRATILEIGSGTGRNLAGLIDAGYHRLAGIEINQSAIDMGRARWAALADIPIQCAPIEDVGHSMPEYTVIYTQGVLMHLPPQSEWVFDAIAQKARRLIMTIENETGATDRSWPHNYGAIFGALGWREVLAHSCEAYPPLPEETICRVFVRVDDV